MNTPGTIERAFQLAPGFTTIDEIRNALKSEGHSNVDAHLAGPSIRADLKRLFASRSLPIAGDAETSAHLAGAN